jgi:MoxR-like ATPase
LHDGRATPALLQRIRAGIGEVIRSKGEVIDRLLVAVLSGGHVLIEDVPGVGKTTLAKALARSFQIGFARVQFTPDLLPADIVGSQILNPKDGSLSFHQGPVFTNVLLADEINRASPRTQSALLEAMNEAQVTVDGTTYPLPQPFVVLATQNPADHQGTYPLPEAQLDRFLMRLGVGYPEPAEELKMLQDHRRAPPVESVQAVAEGTDLLAMQAEVREIRVAEAVGRYLVELVAATRRHKEIEIGVSPRGALALYRAAQAHALVGQRDYVSPDDVQAVSGAVCAHRLVLTAHARYGGAQAAALMESIVRAVPVPREPGAPQPHPHPRQLRRARATPSARASPASAGR